MKVIFMGRKPAASKALEYLIKKNIEVSAVVAPPKEKRVHWTPKLTDTAEKYKIPIVSDNELYRLLNKNSRKKSDGKITENIDIVISFLFWKLIKKVLIGLPRIGCINFHPAPLPDFKGLWGYNFAIYEKLNSWGVSAHFVNEKFDEGDIIKVNKFSTNPKSETAFSLEQKSQRHLLKLFKQVIDIAHENKPLPHTPQGKGRYIKRIDLNTIKEINKNDNLETIERKIRACWYPPYEGAYIMMAGKKFAILNEALLAEIGKKYHNNQENEK